MMLQFLLIPIGAPLFIGVIKKIKARLQNRRGASVVQPYRDLWKQFRKDDIVSSDASYISTIAPYIVCASTLFAGILVPVISYGSAASSMSDVLVFVYSIALGTCFLALLGIDSGGPFGGFGASREMFVSALTESGLILSLFALVIMSGSTNLFSISEQIAGLDLRAFIPAIPAFVAFFFALLAESSRYPFDNPSTHLELTMIHEAMLIDISGKSLALLEWASAQKFMVFAVLGVNLFFPWGIAAAGAGAFTLVVAALVMCAKLLAIAVAVAIIESTTAKLRIFSLPTILILSLVTAIIAIGLTL